MLVAGFDTETTGLSLQTDWIVEAAVVLWDTEATHRKAKVSFSSLIKGEHIPPLTEEVSAIHGIKNGDLITYGSSAKFVLDTVGVLFAQADVVLAHNGNMFDRPMYEANCERLSLAKVDKLWIDSTCDIEYPADFKDRKLIYLAARHGFVNPFPHTALCDVLTMLQVADKYDWAKTLDYAKAPTLVIRADTTFQQKELAKKQGFRWDGDNRVWIKSIKDFQFEAHQKAARDAGFRLTVMKGN